MIPDYLKDLYLEELFEDVESNLVESNNNVEHIVDCEKGKICNFVKDGVGTQEELANKYFEVNNQECKSYCLLKIDNGVIKSIETCKCDCAVLSEEKIGFIEFKANMETDDRSQKEKQYKKAQVQLKATIDYFKKGLEQKEKFLLKIRQCSAHICFRKDYPRLTAQEINFRVKFAKETGICLFFDGKLQL